MHTDITGSNLSLFHTVPVFSPGGATVWTPGPTGAHRDHTVATPASTALNRDTPCWTGVHREVVPVVSNFLKQPKKNKKRRPIPGHHRSSSGINRISTVRPPGDTVANRHELCLRWRYGDSRLSHGVSRRRANIAPVLAGRTTVCNGGSRWMPVKLRWSYGMTRRNKPVDPD